MDYDKLIERLREHTTEWTDTVYGYAGLRLEAATAIETLRADLARVTAERDAVVSDISSVLAEVEEIRRVYGVDNADADNAFADLCGNYCAKCGDNCYKEAENCRCKNYEWRGIKKED